MPMVIIQDCTKHKVVDVLTELKSGKAALIFSHGLGDFCLFLPLFEELQRRFPEWDLYIGLGKDTNYNIHNKAIVMERPYGSYESKFDVLFGIQYPEPPRDQNELRYWVGRNIPNIENISKPLLCNYLEIGMNNFEWKPSLINMGNHASKLNKRIGVHFFGYTSVAKKDIDEKVAEQIWKELEFIGYEPFEMQMIPPYVYNVKHPDFIGSRTLRHYKPDVFRMAQEIFKCNYILGADSGIIYLGGSILGFDKVIGLERLRKFNKVLPIKIDIIDAENYKEGSTIMSIYNKEKEKWKRSAANVDS